ncbi:MAG: SH3 domain-containing protein [Leptospiraceae bacterium]|nr:SH3 domain-containing protein [Leptospiraceae bacterium]
MILGSGLFLRSEPNQKADRIVLMPYKSSGKIIDIKRILCYRKASCSWLKVSYKDKIGWAFAGYIRVFRTEEELKEFLRQKMILISSIISKKQIS